MPSDVERLAVLIEANTRSYERAMVKLQQKTDKASRHVEKRFKDAGKRLDGVFAGIGSSAARIFGALGLGLGGAQALRAIGSASQEYIGLRNALKVVGLEGEHLEQIQSRLFAIAQKNGSAVGSLTSLYSRASQVQKELGVSSSELLQFTEGVSLALRVAGTDSQTASGALLQLSQALASGTVRAEEFNSVNEGALPVLQAVAAGLEEAGGSVGKLKLLVTQGKVSSEAFFRAFLAGLPQLEQQSERMQGTVGQAVQRVTNAFTLFIGKLDESIGASDNAADNFNDLASAIDKLPKFLDAAAGGMDTLNKKLDEFGNSSFWDNINKFLRAHGLMASAAEQQASFAGGTPGGAAPMGGAANVPVPPVRPISLNDHPVAGKAGGTKTGGAATVGVDSFERAIAAAQKHIAVMNAETATIDETVAARERARVATELETAARAANQAQGMANIEVTAEQRVKIDEMSAAMYGAAEASEYANSSLATAARVASQLGDRLEDAAVSGADGLANAFADVVTGAATAEQAFKQFAASVVSELVKIIAKLIIINTLKTIFGFLGFSTGGLVGFSSGGSVGDPTRAGGLYASGGSVAGPGSGTSDSIPAFLSNGEYVVNADAAQRNRDLLDAINFGSLNARRFADGGPVSGGPSGSDRFEPPPPREIRITGVRPDDLFTGRQLLEVINATIADGGRLRVVPA